MTKNRSLYNLIPARLALLLTFLLASITPNKVLGGKSELKNNSPAKKVYQCENCHRKKEIRSVTKLRKLKREHVDIIPSHGGTKINCTHCHDNSQRQSLRQFPGVTVSFEQPSGVCSECHSAIYRDWKIGIHGKVTGGWAKNKKRSHCIECHNPHNVSFPKMKADPPPPRPKLGIPKSKNHS